MVYILIINLPRNVKEVMAWKKDIDKKIVNSFDTWPSRSIRGDQFWNILI